MRTELLSQLSVEEKQVLLGRLLRHKANVWNAVRKQAASSGFVDDAVLDPAIQPIGPAKFQSSPKGVLLTGATGFLGAHLLEELCVRTGATIYCLVRSRDFEHANRKLGRSGARSCGIRSCEPIAIPEQIASRRTFPPLRRAEQPSVERN